MPMLSNTPSIVQRQIPKIAANFLKISRPLVENLSGQRAPTWKRLKNKVNEPFTKEMGAPDNLTRASSSPSLSSSKMDFLRAAFVAIKSPGAQRIFKKLGELAQVGPS